MNSPSFVRPESSKYRFVTLNVAMLPFKANKSFLENPTDRAVKLALFLDALKSDVIFTQELFGFFSGNDLFIQEMNRRGYGMIDNGSARSGVALFYKKAKVTPIRTVFKPHLRKHRHWGLETLAEKGLLIAQFKDNESHEVITAASSHLTGGLGFPYKEENIRLHGSTSKKRAQQMGHAAKILNHIHKVTPNNCKSSCTIFGADTNQDLNLLQDETGSWVRQIGISSGKPNKAGLREYPAGVTKYPEFIEFYDEFHPVKPSNFKPKKVIPAKRGRQDDIIHKENIEETKTTFSGTDVGEKALRKYAETHGGSLTLPEKESKEFHDHVEKSTSGKMLDVMTFNSASPNTTAQTHIVGSEMLSDHQVVVMDVIEKKAQEIKKIIKNSFAEKFYIKLANLKWKYLKIIEARYSVFYNEEQTMLRIDVLNRLLDRIEALCDQDFDEYRTKEMIVAEVSKAILYINSDNKSSELVGLLGDFLLKNNLWGLEFSNNFVSSIAPLKIEPPLVELKYDNSTLKPAEEISDQFVAYLEKIRHNYEYYALLSLSKHKGQNAIPQNHSWHHHLQELEHLIKKFKTPYLIEGQPYKPLSQWSSTSYLTYAQKAIKKTLNTIEKNNPIAKQLENLHKYLIPIVQKHTTLPGFYLHLASFQPSRRDLENNVIYLYPRSDSTIECLFKDPDGKIQQIKIDKGSLKQDIQSALKDGKTLNEAQKKQFFAFLSQKELSSEDQEKLKQRLSHKHNYKLIEQLRHTIKNYEFIRGEERTKGGCYLFRNTKQTDMRRMVLGNMLNYLERQLKTNPSLPHDQFRQIFAKEIKNSMNYIHADHNYGQSWIHLFLPTQSAAYTLLQKFQKEHGLVTNIENKQDSHTLELGSPILAQRDYYVDLLRNIKKSYYDKMGKTSQFRNQWGACYALETLIQNLMQHPLQTYQNNQLRDWTGDELELYICAKWQKLAAGLTNYSLTQEIEKMLPLKIKERSQQIQL